MVVPRGRSRGIGCCPPRSLRSRCHAGPIPGELGGEAGLSATRAGLHTTKSAGPPVIISCGCRETGSMREWRNGRRAGFRCQCPQGRGGSTPLSRTVMYGLLTTANLFWQGLSSLPVVGPCADPDVRVIKDYGCCVEHGLAMIEGDDSRAAQMLLADFENTLRMMRGPEENLFNRRDYRASEDLRSWRPSSLVWRRLNAVLDLRWGHLSLIEGSARDGLAISLPSSPMCGQRPSCARPWARNDSSSRVKCVQSEQRA